MKYSQIRESLTVLMEMRESPKLKKGRYDQIILKILREKPRSREELLELNKKENSPLSKIPYSTLDQRLKQLEKYGIIEHIPDVYKIVRTEEANRSKVQDCMKAIEKEENKNVLLDRIDKLHHMSASGKRLAHLVEFRSGIQDLLENPMLIEHPEILTKLLFTLARILEFEDEHKSPDSDKVVKLLLDNTLPKIIPMIEKDPEFPDNNRLFFLGKTGRKEAVDILLKKIRSHPSKARDNQDLARALRNLCTKHRKLINKNLEDLMRSKNEMHRKVAEYLSHNIRWSRS